jgi:hypothetical protein
MQTFINNLFKGFKAVFLFCGYKDKRNFKFVKLFLTFLLFLLQPLARR